nr:hypothetical protein [uncultured bacterium]
MISSSGHPKYSISGIQGVSRDRKYSKGSSKKQLMLKAYLVSLKSTTKQTLAPTPK